MLEVVCKETYYSVSQYMLLMYFSVAQGPRMHRCIEIVG